MSRFWSYFRETLRWPLIWKEGAISAIAKGIALFMDDIRSAILWLRDQFSPVTCDNVFISLYGASRGIKQRAGETIDQFRLRVIKAYGWMLLGGLNAGLPEILEHYGYPGAEIVNMRDEDPERWAEFTVNVPAPEENFSEADYDSLEWVINDQKPARSKLAALISQANIDQDIIFGGAVAVGITVTVYPQE